MDLRIENHFFRFILLSAIKICATVHFYMDSIRKIVQRPGFHLALLLCVPEQAVHSLLCESVCLPIT